MPFRNFMGLLAFQTLVMGNKMERSNDSLSTRVWIPLGATLFLVALAISAIVVPQLRLLHRSSQLFTLPSLLLRVAIVHGGLARALRSVSPGIVLTSS